MRWNPFRRHAPEKPSRGLIVPAYFQPAGTGLHHWDRLLEAGLGVPVIAIVNPDSGPGSERTAAYARIIDRCVEHGIRTLGYVSTAYGDRAIPAVEHELERWIGWYPPLSGIFFDEQSAEIARLDYYRTLADRVRRRLRHGIVATNQGFLGPHAYLTAGAADVASVYENRGGFETYELPDELKSLREPELAAFVYGVKSMQRMQNCLRRAARQTLTWIYVTDADLPNPWDRLPSYWDDEVQLLVEINTVTPVDPS